MVSPQGLPLGNLTSQFFANIYLNELDKFVKHKLKAKYYVRYVEDIVLLSNSKTKLEKWKKEIEIFLNNKLNLELHPDKSKIISLSHGVDFVGFRNFYQFKLLRKRSIMKMKLTLKKFKNLKISYKDLTESFQGWQAHSKLANTFKVRKKIASEIAKAKHNNV